MKDIEITYVGCVDSLRKTVDPSQEQSRRTEHSLHLWVQEAKGMPTKKK